MKYLSDYMEAAQTAAFDKAGAFFAFGKEQYNKAAKPGVEYVSMQAGLICPKDNALELHTALDTIYKQAIAQDKSDHTPEQIIKRELFNHECQITMDDSNARDKLADYSFTDEQFKATWDVFWQECIDNDYF